MDLPDKQNEGGIMPGFRLARLEECGPVCLRRLRRFFLNLSGVLYYVDWKHNKRK